MKTAEEWMQVFGHAKTDSMTVSVDPVISLPEKTVTVLYPEDIKAIQLDALREAEKAAAKNNDGEMFEDGLSADLHESGIETIPAAYRQGKDDARNEITDAILARIKEVEG